MNGLKLPNLYADSVQVSTLEVGQDPFDLLLDSHFNCEHTKKYIKSKMTMKRFERLIQNWSFKVDEDLKLSQSKIKGFWSMVAGDACPRTFEKSLVDRNVSIFKESDAMIHGQLFEHMSTGQTNYTGDVPDYSKIELKNGNLSKVGQVIEKQAEQWKDFASQYTHVVTGRQLMYKSNDYIITSLPDVLTEGAIIDLKLGDPDGTFGDFAWNDEKLPKQDKLLLQAKINVFIWLKQTKRKLPFIFYIASKSSNHAKARKIVFKDFDGMVEEIESLLKDTYKGIKFLCDNKLFTPTPEIKFCEFCKVKRCSKKTEVAIIKNIEV